MRQQLIQINSVLIQMEQIHDLNKDEQEQFCRMRNSQNGIDDKTFELCLRYFIQYKKRTGDVSGHKIPIVMKSALFIAEKSQNIETINGQRIALPSMTLGHLVKCHQLQQVMLILKDFSQKITVQDKFAAEQLKSLIKEISFLITFYKKFENIVQTLELKQRMPQTGNEEYLKNWKSFAWLLYIQIKNKAFNKSLNIVQNTCMLAHTIAYMLALTWEYVVPRNIVRDKKINEQSSLTKEVLTLLRDRVLEMFSITNMDMYTKIASEFEKIYERELKMKGIIKSSNHSVDDFLSPELLPLNYRKLDKLYEKTMGPSDLDERIFFKERLANMTPSKFTPFARQGYANKGRKVGHNDTTYKENYSSHRILNYEMIDKIETNMKTNDGLNISKLPKSVLISPSPSMKVNLICQTPITAGMAMYNYVRGKADLLKERLMNQKDVVKRPFEKDMLHYIEKFVEIDKKKGDKKSKEMMEHMIYSFFKLVLEDYLITQPKDKDNKEMFMALMALTLEIVLFVNNSSVTFQDIEKQIQISSFQMWKACDFFLKYDKEMPQTMKMHIIDLEAGYVTYKLWKDKKNIEIIARLTRGQKQMERIPELADRLFRKLLIQTAFQVNHMGVCLGLEDLMIQHVFETMKEIYTNHLGMLENHSIDQLIMCGIFAFNKVQKLDLSFREIIDHYKETNLYNKDIHEEIMHKIQVKDRDINLIQFYNQVFIHPLKQYILSFKNKSGEQQHRKNVSNPLLMSPLKDVLPRQLNKRNVKKVAKDANKHLLISYTDSPLVKDDPISLKGITHHHPKTAKMIDFDNEEGNMKVEKEKNRQYQKLSPKAMGNPQYQYKKGNTGHYPWKAQQPQQPANVGGLTPTRINKTVSNGGNFELNQFTTNPTHTLKIGGAAQKGQSLGFGKGRMGYQ